MKKRLFLQGMTTLVVVLLSIAFVSCDMNSLSGTSASADSGVSSKSVALTDSALPQKIVGTAGIGSEAFFFEFDTSGTQKFVRAMVPVSSDGYLKNGKILYNKKTYALTSFVYDSSTGLMTGTTATVAGISYAFQGNYSNTIGFIGYIQKVVNGEVSGGEYDYFSGVPVFAGKNFENYIGYATFLFESDTTALIFNALIDSDSGQIYGTWCETKPGIGNIHGSLVGTRDGQKVSFTGDVWDAYKELPGLDLDTMSADGEGWYKNSGEKTIAGEFTIHWREGDWSSDFAAVKVVN